MKRRSKVVKSGFVFTAITACIVILAISITLICVFTINADTTPTVATPENVDTNSIHTELSPVNTQYFIPESAEADDAFFADTLFIGNSITEGFQKFSGLNTATFYQGRGMTVESIHRMKVVNEDNSSDMDGNGDKTVIDALHDRKFNQIYILLGSNELGWVYYDLFINQYAQLIDTIRELQPNAKICVQSVLPVSAQRSETDEVYTNEKIENMNQMIIRMSIEKNIFYLNTAEAFKDENGALPGNLSSDGIHLTPDACKIWSMYVKTHIMQ